MGTAVAIRGADGVAIAADRRIVEAGRVRSDDVDHIFTSERIAVATVGAAADVQACHRELDAALRQYRMDHDRGPDATAARRIVSDVTSDAGVEALLAVPDSAGTAQLFQIDATGGVTDENRAAVGEGAATAIGILENVDREERISTLETTLQEVLETASERETAIGGRIDTELIGDTT